MIPQKKEEEMTTDGYLKGSKRSHNQKKEISRDASRRLGWENIGVVSTNRLMESYCRDGLFVVRYEQIGFHEGNKTMATDSHSKGSKRDYERSSKNKLDREIAEVKVQLEMMRESIQRDMEN